MPARFEADQDSVFTVAFSISINQKKMKRIEKEYMTMKTKEAEDEMEIRVKFMHKRNIIIHLNDFSA